MPSTVPITFLLSNGYEMHRERPANHVQKENVVVGRLERVGNFRKCETSSEIIITYSTESRCFHRPKLYKNGGYYGAEYGRNMIIVACSDARVAGNSRRQLSCAVNGRPNEN